MVSDNSLYETLPIKSLCGFYFLRVSADAADKADATDERGPLRHTGVD